MSLATVEGLALLMMGLGIVALGGFVVTILAGLSWFIWGGDRVLMASIVSSVIFVVCVVAGIGLLTFVPWPGFKAVPIAPSDGCVRIPFNPDAGPASKED